MIQRIEGIMQLKAVFSQCDERNNDGECQQAIGGNVLKDTCYPDAAQIRSRSQSE